MNITESQRNLLVEISENNNKITILDQRRMRPLRALNDKGMVSLRAFEMNGHMGMKAEITNLGLNQLV